MSGFLALLAVASTPVVEVLLIAVLGAYLAGSSVKVLTPSARTDMNRVVYAVFTPALVMSSLARTVTLQEAVSWWFMPVNIGLVFLTGGVLGWVAAALLLAPEDESQQLKGLVIASCSAPNLGNLLLIVIPAVCPPSFGHGCTERGLSYASFSMALGGLYIWTHTHSVMKKKKPLPLRHDDPKMAVDSLTLSGTSVSRSASSSSEQEQQPEEEEEAPLLPSRSYQATSSSRSSMWHEQMVEALTAPPMVGAILGFIVGAVPWLRSVMVGEHAPLRVLHDSLKLLGDGTVPCVILILGGNLTFTKGGVRKTTLSPWLLMAIICIRYLLLPVIGIAIVRSAHHLGFLPPDPLYQYVLMLQFALPPAMSIGTIAQLYDVAQEDCSIIFLWTYLVAALALTVWSTVFMSILAA